MIKTIPLTELRPALPDVMDRIKRYFERYIITRHGHPEAVMLAQEDYESLMETLEVLADQELLKGIKKSQQEFAAGKGIRWEDAKKQLGL